MEDDLPPLRGNVCSKEQRDIPRNVGTVRRFKKKEAASFWFMKTTLLLPEVPKVAELSSVT